MFCTHLQRPDLASGVVHKLLGSGWVGRGGSRVQPNTWHPGVQLPVGQKPVKFAGIHGGRAGCWFHHW